MPSRSLSSRRLTMLDLVRTGLYAGLAGGLAEILVVWAYSALNGGDAAMVARGVGAAIGLAGTSVMTGIAVHLGLGAALGIGLTIVLHMLVGRNAGDPVRFVFMVGSLQVVWMINFFIVLPVVSPAFVHLLPYSVTLSSKLLFGFVAAVTLRIRAQRVEMRGAQGRWLESAGGSVRTVRRPASSPLR